MPNKFGIIALTLCLSLSLYAQYSDKVLYDAYISEDLSLWKSYLLSEDFYLLSEIEQARYINYEYGYVAATVHQDPDAGTRLDSLLNHIDAMEGILPPATILAYRSAWCAYKGRHHRIEMMTKGMQSKSYAKQAVIQDPDNALAHNVMGFVEFYTPKFVGGSKERALAEFNKAREIMSLAGDTLYNWNYHSILSHIRLCEEKYVSNH